MTLQNYELKTAAIKAKFEAIKKKHPEKLKQTLNLSWSNWGFGMETLEISAKRLAGAGVESIELHGNHYGPDLGYQPSAL